MSGPTKGKSIFGICLWVMLTSARRELFKISKEAILSLNRGKFEPLKL